MDGPAIQLLTGDRLHLQHGPIDVVLRAWGGAADVEAAYRAAAERFATVLGELVGELAELRRPVSEAPRVSGAVARRMLDAVRPFAGTFITPPFIAPPFITPMAAVAGAVADELMAAMRAAAPLSRAYVNDGGDIAVHLSPGATLTLGIAGDFSGGPVPALNGSIRLTPELGIGGIATSGARGRSFSLGIADSVTVLARTAAAADAAATLIANAVDLDSPAVERRPACTLDPDSDLGHRLVTVAVGPLTDAEIDRALAAGAAEARRFQAAALVHGAALMLAGRTLSLGVPAPQLEETPA